MTPADSARVWQSQAHMRCVQCQRWRPRPRRPRRCRRCTRRRPRACTRPRTSGRRSRRRRRARPRRCASCRLPSRRKRASWPCRACARPCASRPRRARCRRASSCRRACARPCARRRSGSRRLRAACSSRRRGGRPAAGGCRAGPAARPAPPARTASSPPSMRCARTQARGTGFDAAPPAPLLPLRGPSYCVPRISSSCACSACVKLKDACDWHNHLSHVIYKRTQGAQVRAHGSAPSHDPGAPNR